MRIHTMKMWQLRLEQVRAFLAETRRPLPLILDLLQLQRRPFIAEDRTGRRIWIRPGSGERFAFYENILRQDYLRHGVRLRPGDTVVDIGANIGSFAILAASLVGPAGRVIALEPDPATYRQLLENIALNNLANVQAQNVAVAARDGTIQLHRGANSLFASIHARVDGHPTGGDLVTVPCRSLNTLLREHNLERVDLMKVDCEGAEHEIFEHLAPQLARRLEQISMETHDVGDRTSASIRQRLEALGYAVTPSAPVYACWKANGA